MKKLIIILLLQCIFDASAMDSCDDLQDARYQSLNVGNERILCVATLHDGRVLLGDVKGSVQLWNLQSRKCARIFQRQSDMIKAAVAVPGKNRAISASGNTVQVWDTSNDYAGLVDGLFNIGRKPLRIFKGHAGDVLCVAMLGEDVLSGSCDKTIRRWNIKTGQCVQIYRGYGDNILAVAGLEDGTFVSASFDKAIRRWNAETGKCLQIYKGAHSMPVVSLLSLPGSKIASAGKDGRTVIWDVESGIWLKKLQESGPQTCLTSLEGKRLVAAGSNEQIQICDLGKETPWRGALSDSPEKWLSITAMAGLGDRLIATGLGDGYVGKLMVWDLRPGTYEQDAERVLREFYAKQK